MIIRILLKLLMVILVAGATLSAQENTYEPGSTIFQRIGEQVPMDLKYVAENHDTVTLGELITKPTVLTFVYYNCPGVCTPLLSGVVETFRSSRLVPGKDFQAITLSFNELEKPELALSKKNNYLSNFEGSFPPAEWRWLTGKGWDIKRLTMATGFEYVSNGEDFYHPAAMIILSPEGKVVRYLTGTYFEQKDFELAILEATPEAERGIMAGILAAFYRFNPETSHYQVRFSTAAVSLGILLLIPMLLIAMTRKYRGSVLRTI